MPPPEMAEYIGDQPEPARIAQLKGYREASARRALAPPRTMSLERRVQAVSQYESRSPWQVSGPSGSTPWHDAEREAEREAEAIERIMRTKR